MSGSCLAVVAATALTIGLVDSSFSEDAAESAHTFNTSCSGAIDVVAIELLQTTTSSGFGSGGRTLRGITRLVGTEESGSGGIVGSASVSEVDEAALSSGAGLLRATDSASSGDDETAAALATAALSGLSVREGSGRVCMLRLRPSDAIFCARVTAGARQDPSCSALSCRVYG